MEGIYNIGRLEVHEKRVAAGRKLACHVAAVSDTERRTGKTLKVVAYSQGEGHVPSIRVAGKWLERFGFGLGAKVVLTAADGRILITRKEV